MKLRNSLYTIFLLTVFALPGIAREAVLKDVFKKHFYVGTALNDQICEGKNPAAAAIATRQFNAVTPENELKWERVHPEMGKFDFRASDRFVDFAKKNNMLIIGHVLLWHRQTPDWVFEDSPGKLTDRETLLKRLHEHIFTVAGHYKGRIHGWDVVNEAVNDDGSMRQSKWFKIIGDDYIEKAFQWAHEAAPDAELYYNDYNMWKPGKRRTVAKMVRRLQEKGIRIDGIGMQGHWSWNYLSNEELDASIEDYSALGVQVDITELDIAVLPRKWNLTDMDISASVEINEVDKELDPYTEGFPVEMQQKLAERYAGLFRVFVKHRDKIGRVTFWGVYDGMSWLNGWPIRGRTSYPLIFDRNYHAKPAFDAIVATARSRN